MSDLDKVLNEFLKDGWTISYSPYEQYTFEKPHDVFKNSSFQILADKSGYIINSVDNECKKYSYAVVPYKLHQLLTDFFKIKGWM